MKKIGILVSSGMMLLTLMSFRSGSSLSDNFGISSQVHLNYQESLPDMPSVTAAVARGAAYVVRVTARYTPLLDDAAITPLGGAAVRAEMNLAINYDKKAKTAKMASLD